MKVKIAAVAIISLVGTAVCLSTVRAQQTPQQRALAILLPQASRSVWDGVYTEEQAKRGGELYEQQCSTCHGALLTGDGEAPALTGSAFLANWSGLTVGDLSERIRQSMPSDNPGRLSRQQVVDILAHVLRFNGFPVGQTELVRETEPLKQIRIEASKP